MNYGNLDIEWDETCNEMARYNPVKGDPVLCWKNKPGDDHTKAGTVIDVEDTEFYEYDTAITIKLDDGTIDVFNAENVLKRKDSIDKLFDDFNRDMKKQFDITLNHINSINQILREAV